MHAQRLRDCLCMHLGVLLILLTVGAASIPLLNAQEPGGEIQAVRPRIDLTAATDLTTSLEGPLALEAAEQIGPGSALLITIPNEGRFGCTANFVWTDGAKLYLGAAGHCFIPATAKATHGDGADYDASGVEVSVCVNNCDANFNSMTLVGELVPLGRVAYARQTDATGAEQVGHDFGVVEIPDALAPQIRLTLPVFGGPTGVDTLEPGEFGCHFGHGLVVGETFLTKARVGIGGGSDENFWMGDFAAAFGDSGSALVSCSPTLTGFRGRGAVGVLTHLGVSVPDPGGEVTGEHGVVFGTTVRRAVEMATEAGIFLNLAN